MEQRLGRYLKHEEYIHHINGIRDDDRIENLQITSIGEHNRIHKTKTLIDHPSLFIDAVGEFLGYKEGRDV
jgi:hypothetical protein